MVLANPMVIPMPKALYIQRIYMVLANPKHTFLSLYVYKWFWPTQNIPFCHFTTYIHGSGQPKTYRSVTLQRIYMVLANPKHTFLSHYNVNTWFWPTKTCLSVTLQRIYMVLANPKHTFLSLDNGLQVCRQHTSI